MARTRKRRRYSRDEIRTFLESFDQSGLTQVTFARRRGLSVSTLRSWLDRRRHSGAVASPRFLPVAITDAGLRGAPGLELELAGNRRLHIPVDIDSEALRSLLPIILTSC